MRLTMLAAASAVALGATAANAQSVEMSSVPQTVVALAKAAAHSVE